MVFMFYVRGILQVIGYDLSVAMNASLSGVAGISHIILGVAIVWILMCLKEIHLED